MPARLAGGARKRCHVTHRGGLCSVFASTGSERPSLPLPCSFSSSERLSRPTLLPPGAAAAEGAWVVASRKALRALRPRRLPPQHPVLPVRTPQVLCTSCLMASGAGAHPRMQPCFSLTRYVMRAHRRDRSASPSPRRWRVRIRHHAHHPHPDAIHGLGSPRARYACPCTHGHADAAAAAARAAAAAAAGGIGVHRVLPR